MGIFSKEPAQVESFEAETVVSVDVNGLLAEAERIGGDSNAGEEKEKGSKKTLLTNVSRETSGDVRLANGRFGSAPDAVKEAPAGASLPSGALVPAAGSSLPQVRSWGKKKEPEREAKMFAAYVKMGDTRSADKVAKLFKLSASRVRELCTDWSWTERVAIMEAEQALMSNAMRTDDMTDALRAVGIGAAREIMKKVKVDKDTGMITGVEGLEIGGKVGLSSVLRLVSDIRSWLGEGDSGEIGKRGRGPGGLKGNGMASRPILNFIIKK